MYVDFCILWAFSCSHGTYAYFYSHTMLLKSHHYLLAKCFSLMQTYKVNSMSEYQKYIFFSNSKANRCSFCFSVGHNEIIGVCRLGCGAEGLGRDHWNEMLAYPRKPIAHWHPLLESKKTEKEVSKLPPANANTNVMGGG